MYKNGVLTVDVADATWVANDMGEHGPIRAKSASGEVSVRWRGKDGKTRETAVGLLKHSGPGGEEIFSSGFTHVEVTHAPNGFWRYEDEDEEVAIPVAFPDDLKIELV